MNSEMEIKSWDDPRKCTYCGSIFRPRRPQDKNSRFCCTKHRYAWHRHGSAPFEKLEEHLTKAVMAKFINEFSELRKRIEKIEKELDLEYRNVVMLQPKESNEPANKSGV